MTENDRNDVLIDSCDAMLENACKMVAMAKELLSALGYLLLFSVCANLTVENAGPAVTLLNRIFFGLVAVGIVLFTGNYLTVQQKFPLTRRQKPWVRRLGILLVDLFLFVLAAVLCGILSALFFPSAAALL